MCVCVTVREREREMDCFDISTGNPVDHLKTISAFGRTIFTSPYPAVLLLLPPPLLPPAAVVIDPRSLVPLWAGLGDQRTLYQSCQDTAGESREKEAVRDTGSREGRRGLRHKGGRREGVRNERLHEGGKKKGMRKRGM